ncbi:caspase family protein [Rugamonas rubra]|uniref:Caspase domain-containing protein n=1 Tax=Rugamonas rubra TaxID=758825 RepID=A0A1I4URC1_9BURK|nr:caspase family protein [Rugamonas rubra]SFM91534.1 Caspase domain-containing protein [Rugamonas rubra]
MPANLNDFALVVGINDYPSFRSLTGAIRDATDFASWLKDQNTGGGLPDANCAVVLSTPDSGRPAHEQIDEALEGIFNAVAVEGGRRFYFYFSGHGIATDQTKNHLCLAKWSEKWRKNALDVQDYLNTVAATGKFEEIIFLLDCCRVRVLGAGGLVCNLALPRPNNAPDTRIFMANATEVFTAAFEAEVAGSAQSDNRGHFTQALIEGLQGAAAGPGGGVSAADLKNYLETNVPRIAAERKHAQTPEVTNGLLRATRFGSAQPNAIAGWPVTITFSAARAADILLEDSQTDEVRRGPTSTGPWELHLNAGLHLLTDLGSNEEKSFRVKAGMGVHHVQF